MVFVAHYSHVCQGLIPRHGRTQQSGKVTAPNLLHSAPEATTVLHCNCKEPETPAGSDANFFEAAELLQLKISGGERAQKFSTQS